MLRAVGGLSQGSLCRLGCPGLGGLLGGKCTCKGMHRTRRKELYCHITP